MIISRLLGGFCVICFCVGDQRLLIDQLRWDFLELENEVWNFSSNGLLYKSQEAAEAYLSKKFQDFDRKLMQMPQDLLYGSKAMRMIPNFLFFYSELKMIETLYQKFKDYQQQVIAGSTDRVSLEDIIYDITNNKSGAEKTVDRAYELAYKDYDGIEKELDRMLQENYWCKNKQQSPQQLIYNLYNLFALAELKAYILQQFSHLGNRLWDKGDFVDKSIASRKKYESRVTERMKSLSTSIRRMREVWRCDPEVFVKGKNYDQFTRLLQGHIENEVDMSSKRTCRQTCSAYSLTKSYGCYDDHSEFCRRVERCNGNIIGCFFVESHASICVSPDRNRRYDFIRYNSGKTFGNGKGKSCSNRRTVNSWTRWFVRCHYCMCLCDEQGPLSDRYINLRPVLADIKNNRVVTGVRLIKNNRIVHLQIQEGKLLPYGYINESTVHWVNVDNYKLTDAGVRNKEDFFTMSYGERSMALDDIQVKEENHIVTGVRFEFIKNKIHFEIYVSPFDWHTGRVSHNNGYYIYESNPNGRKKIDIDNPDIPTNTKEQSWINHLGIDSYVEFTNSAFGKDAAQSTVPFIDIQEVVNKPAVPLMGAGIYYKGNRGYGGFIAPRIQTYDFGKHVSSKLPNMGDRHDVAEEKDVELN
ncbi:unnamed protein product [Ceutorhynchus assimilis]|uniref:Uncharacterized protein n=1 Tax=Ceutorhynchus assimilis TaxID=467358 RepID=A0A9N9MZH5_9CUCU|nr:unnamed protein product [Ceutorhynchus assimilis]